MKALFQRPACLVWPRLALGLLWLGASACQAGEARVVPLHRADAQALAELLQAQAPSGARVQALDSRLILTGPAHWQARALHLIEQLDHPPRTLSIRIRRVAQNQTSPRGGVEFDSPGLRVSGLPDARLSTRPERMVVVDEGSPAVIAEGTGRQSVQAWAGPWGWGGAVTPAGPRNSLAVRARLTGDGRVLLTLEAEEDGGTRRVLTTRSGPLGRWMALESRNDGTRLEVKVDPVIPGSPPPP